MQQFETLLGGKGGQLALAVIAFLVAAVLVLVIVRMLFGGKLRAPGSRARQARLGIVDAFDLDRQRQLIIIRRDNTEHLIMIGGPNDLVIEPEIVRVEARDYRNREKEPGFGDARIPAPFTPTDRPELKAPGEAPGAPLPPLPTQPHAPPQTDEPTLPMPLPEVAAIPVPPPAPPPAPEPTPIVPRGPTFPLPQRRPAPAPAGERRPPVPPRLPDSASRASEPAPAAPGLDLGSANGETPDVAPPGPIPAPPVAPAPPMTPTRPVPSFRPLPPRPPVRPLQRVTPKSTMPQGAGGGSAPDPVLPSMPAQAPAAPSPAPVVVQPMPPQPAPPLAAAAPEPPQPAPIDDDLSLEEEMAKLLGRG